MVLRCGARSKRSSVRDGQQEAGIKGKSRSKSSSSAGKRAREENEGSYIDWDVIFC